MHIPDNYLSPQTDAVMAVAMVPVWVHCIKKVRATLDREHMAFLGICAAFSFLLMMFNVPLPGGTTGHAVGGALIAPRGLVTPSVIVILIVAAFLKAFRDSKWVSAAFYGLRPASTALVAAAGISVVLIAMVNTGAAGLAFFNWKAIALAAVLLVLTHWVKFTKNLHPIWFILASAVVGVVFKF